MAKDWDPALYDRFAEERARPVVDLLARVNLEAPERVVDLGCGSGASTAPLIARWPQADVIGIDTSPAMLAAARAAVPGARFDRLDVSAFRVHVPIDLLFSNATLHWVPDHATLLPRLMAMLAPGGVLAVQVPDNLDEPSHVAMREVAQEPAFAPFLAGIAGGRERMGTLDAIYDLVAPAAARVEMWRTTYVHPLDGPEAVVDMVRGAGLKPFLDPLDEATTEAFLARYGERIAAVYPRRVDGRVLFRFPRLFFVAVKR